MTETTQAAGGLTPDVIDVFARGLYHLATVDGIDEREEKLIREFLEETGSSLRYEELGEADFSVTEAAMVLETSHIRRVFVKAAVALVKADGVYSDAERQAVGQLADAFELSNAEFGDLEQEAARLHIED